MSTFISWIEQKDNSVIFLTDDNVFSSQGKNPLLGPKGNDILGHHAIRTFFGQDGSIEKENKEFWKKENFPYPIAERLDSPKTMLATWGKMLKLALLHYDAYFILTNAPKPWLDEELVNICFRAVAKHPEFSSYTLGNVRYLTNKQRETLVKTATRSVYASYLALRDARDLTLKQRQILVGAVSISTEYSHNTIRDAKNITPKERRILDRAAKHYYAALEEQEEY